VVGLGAGGGEGGTCTTGGGCTVVEEDELESGPWKKTPGLGSTVVVDVVVAGLVLGMMSSVVLSSTRAVTVS